MRVRGRELAEAAGFVSVDPEQRQLTSTILLGVSEGLCKSARETPWLMKRLSVSRHAVRREGSGCSDISRKRQPTNGRFARRRLARAAMTCERDSWKAWSFQLSKGCGTTYGSRRKQMQEKGEEFPDGVVAGGGCEACECGQRGLSRGRTGLAVPVHEVPVQIPRHLPLLIRPLPRRE